MEFTSKPDRTSTIRQQTSRIYMTTIAANEREERLLTKKLDALDLQHKSQYIKMKKSISFTEYITKKKFPEFAARMSSPSDKNRGYRHSLAAVSNLKCGFRNSFSRDSTPRSLPCLSSPDHNNEHSEDHLSSQIISTKPLEPLPKQIKTKNLQKPDGKVSFNTGHVGINSPAPDADPIKYTEQEVGRLRKSWAGRKTPPKRKPSFLPQLESIASNEVAIPNGKGVNKAIKNKRLSRPMIWEQKQKTLPNIDLQTRKLSTSVPTKELDLDTIEDNVMQISSSAPNF